MAGQALTAGEKVKLFTDHEGGNIQIIDNDGSQIYQMDAIDGHFRLYTHTISGENVWSVCLLATDGYSYFNRLYGAVWNDYAEFRKTVELNTPGYCVVEVGDDSLRLSSKRLEKGAMIVSDTYGFAIGETEQSKTPIAVSGRVLAYTNEPVEEYKKHIGDCVCAGPNGKICIMTDEEAMRYPASILGTISAVPEYETWGTGNVVVDGRVWIKVK